MDRNNDVKNSPLADRSLYRSDVAVSSRHFTAEGYEKVNKLLRAALEGKREDIDAFYAYIYPWIQRVRVITAARVFPSSDVDAGLLDAADDEVHEKLITVMIEKRQIYAWHEFSAWHRSAVYLAYKRVLNRMRRDRTTYESPFVLDVTYTTEDQLIAEEEEAQEVLAKAIENMRQHFAEEFSLLFQRAEGKTLMQLSKKDPKKRTHSMIIVVCRQLQRLLSHSDELPVPIIEWLETNKRDLFPRAHQWRDLNYTTIMEDILSLERKKPQYR